MRSFLYAAAIALAAGLTALRCSTPTAGIETTNGATVAASVSSITGTVPPYARVSVFGSTYIPVVDSGLGLTTAVGDSGVFGFEGLAAGVYTVVVELRDKDKAAAFQGISVGPSAVDSVRQKTLEPTGSLSGSVTAIPGSASAILLYLVGTDYYMALPAPGPFALEFIAPGIYELQAIGLASNGDFAAQTLAPNRDMKTIEVFASKETKADTLALR